MLVAGDSLVLRRRIDVMMRAELSRQRLFVIPAIDRDRLESHPTRILDTEMSESANTVHCDNLSGARD